MPGPELSFSSNAFTKFTLFEAATAISQAGYGAMEVLADSPHFYAETTDLLEVEKFKAHCDNLGIKIANVNANTAVGFYNRSFWEPLFEPSLAHPDESLRRWRINYTCKCIDIASILESPNISITSGRMVPGIMPGESKSLFIQSLRELLKYTTKKRIRMGIEYEPGLLIESKNDLSEILEFINSPYLGANLDLGHSHVLKEVPDEVFSDLTPYIFHIHLEDIKDGKHYHLIPGHGDLDFDKIFKLMQKFHYTDFVTVELYTYPDNPQMAAHESLEFLKQFCDS